MNQPQDGLRVVVTVSLNDDQADRVASVLDDRGTLHRVRRGDPAFGEAVAECDVLLGHLPAEQAGRAAQLRWLQMPSAGVPPHVRTLPERIVVTNARGVHSVPMAEHVLAMMLTLTRDIRSDVRWQFLRQWRHPSRRVELGGTTCVVVGLGDIGREVAKRLSALGVRVVGVRRHASTDAGEAPEGVERVVGRDRLDDVLAEADHVVVTLPATDETRGMFDAARIARIRRGARFYNVGRGATVDEAALIAALRSGHLAGAGLDVFEREPLPRRSRTWSTPNLIVSPHSSADSPLTRERWTELFTDNLRRFLAGEPLRNVVDRSRGY